MTAVTHPAIVIERRFHSPLQSGHGGSICGLLARELHRAVRVSLCSPAPLKRPLTTAHDGDDKRLTLSDGETILADAQATTPELNPPLHVELDAAQAASRRCLGSARHPFPPCFGCGPNRAAG
jgi:hypothetical protein